MGVIRRLRQAANRASATPMYSRESKGRKRVTRIYQNRTRTNQTSVLSHLARSFILLLTASPSLFLPLPICVASTHTFQFKPVHQHSEEKTFIYIYIYHVGVPRKKTVTIVMAHKLHLLGVFTAELSSQHHSHKPTSPAVEITGG
jgi:hypothetical protein